MSAIRRNLTVDYKTDFVLNLLYKDSAGVAINLSGYTITWEIKEHEKYSTPIASVAVTGTAAGEIKVLVPAATNNLAPNRYYYDLKMVDGTGKTTWLLWGNYNLNGADRN